MIISNATARSIQELHFSNPQGFVLSTPWKYCTGPRRLRATLQYTVGYSMEGPYKTQGRHTKHVRYRVQGLGSTQGRYSMEGRWRIQSLQYTATLQYTNTIQGQGLGNAQVRYRIQGLRYIGTTHHGLTLQGTGTNIPDTGSTVHRGDTAWRDDTGTTVYRDDAEHRDASIRLYDAGYVDYCTQGRYSVQVLQYTGTQQYTVP
jgi:hypothetical protein